MRALIIILILYASAVTLTFVSISPINNFTIAASVALLLIIASFLLSFCLTVFYEGSFKERYGHAMVPAFMLSPGTYIAGYSFIIIESLIRN